MAGGNWVEIGNTVMQWFTTVAQTGAQMGLWGNNGNTRPPLGYEQYYSTPQQEPTYQQAGFGNTTTLLLVGVGLYLLLKK